MFGIPLSQTIANDRLSEEARGVATGVAPGSASPAELRRRSHHGSRTSFSSLSDAARADQVGLNTSVISGH